MNRTINTLKRILRETDSSVPVNSAGDGSNVAGLGQNLDGLGGPTNTNKPKLMRKKRASVLDRPLPEGNA